MPALEKRRPQERADREQWLGCQSFAQRCLEKRIPQPSAGKEESFHREKKNLSKEKAVTC